MGAKQLIVFCFLGLLQITGVHGQCLKGEYTIGGADPDFVTVNEAVEQLHEHGVCGSVLFQFREGEYSFFELRKIQGVSITNTITFQGDSEDRAKVVIKRDRTEYQEGEDYVVRLDSASFIRFKDLSIIRDDNSKVDDLHAINLGGECLDLELKDVYVYGKTSAVYSDSGDYGRIRILDSYLRGSTPCFLNKVNCKLLEVGNSKIDAFSKHFRIRSSLIDHLYIHDSEIDEIDGFYEISNVRKASLVNNESRGFGSILALDSIEVRRNEFFKGMSLRFSEHKISNQILVVNNRFRDGMVLYKSASGKILNNHFTTEWHCIDIHESESIYLSVFNNVLHSEKSKCVRMQDVRINRVASDCNTFYSDEYPQYDFPIAAGEDEHSFLKYPNILDFHAPFDVDLDGKGLSFSELKGEDINGRKRNDPPDIGAYEGDIPERDVQIEGFDSISEMCIPGKGYLIYARFKNTGQDSIHSITYTATAGPERLDSTISVSLASGEVSEPIQVMNFKVKELTKYDLRVKIEKSNGKEEKYTFNDNKWIRTNYAAMKGEYTIGGIKPDFETIADAALYMKYAPFYGDVIMLLRDGYYNPGIDLNRINYNEDGHWLTFKSENDDPSRVKLSGVKLFACPRLVFEGMTIKNSDYGFTANKVDGCIFRNCVFNGNGILVEYGGDSLVVENCEFNSPTTCIRSTSSLENIIASHNQFLNSSDVAIYMKGGSCEFISNYYNGPGTFIKFQEVSGNVKVAGNDIRLQGGKAFDMNHSLRFNGVRHIYNNVITCTDRTPIELNSSSGFNFYHNSIQMFEKDTTITNKVKAIFQLYDSRYIDAVNNILSNHAKDGQIFHFTEFGIDPDDFEIDFNLLYLPNNDEFNSGGERTDNSRVFEPAFVSEENLRLANSDSNYRFASPHFHNFVGEDFDARTRPVPPAVGAFEPPELGNDISPIALVSPKGCGTGHHLYVSLQNNGADTLKRALVEWQIADGDTHSLHWRGSIAPLSIHDSLYLGVVDTSLQEPTSIQVWTRYPNGMIDSQQANDTLRVDSVEFSYSGIYSVGGKQPDFRSLDEALERLKSHGICGDVVLNLAPHIYGDDHPEYQSDYVISDIPGLSQENGLTIQSRGGMTECVVINKDVTLDSVQNVHFKNVTLAKINFLIDHGSENVSIEESILKVWRITAQNGVKDLRIIDNQFMDGYFPALLEVHGTAVLPLDDIEILGNKGTKRAFVNGEYINNISIRENEVSAIHGSPVVLKHCSGKIEMVANQINWSTLNNRDPLVSMAQLIGTSDQPIEIYNNMFVMNISTFADGGSHSGIGLAECEHLNFYHNTVKLEYAYGVQSYGVVINGGNNIRLKNNILDLRNNWKNPGSAYPFRISDGLDPVTVCDYNLYNDASHVGFYYPKGTSDFTSLSLEEWKDSTGWDQHSLQALVEYESLTDLHLSQNNVSPFQSGLRLDEVQVDIDGELRDVSPFFGADEYTAHAINASVIDWRELTNCFGVKQIGVWLQNTGLDTLKSVDLVWQINGEPSGIVNWNGELPSTDSVFVELTEYKLENLGVAQFSIWSETPNLQEDPYTTFDTVHFDLMASMSGPYTVGGEEPDFKDVREAVEVIEERGICDSVIFNIRPGSYYSTKIPLIPGVGEDKRIIFQAENGDSSSVVISNNTELEGARHIVLRNLTFLNDISAGQAIHIDEGCYDIQVRNNQVMSKEGNTTANIYVGYFMNMADDRITVINSNQRLSFENNYIVNGGDGIYVQANLQSGQSADSITIRNNRFENVNGYAIRMTYAAKGTLIEGNQIQGIQNKPAIYVYRYWNNLRILSNRIWGGVAGQGIYLHVAMAGNKRGSIVANNEISIHSDHEEAYGLYLRQADSLLVTHNSVRISGNDQNIAVHALTHNGIRLTNNQFINEGGGPVFNLYQPSYQGTEFISNNYFTSGVFALRSESDSLSFDEYEQSFPNDQGALFEDPVFYEEGRLISGNPALLDAGTEQAEITTDIDGNTRIGKPDIGAYELVLNEYDLGITGLTLSTDTCGDSLSISGAFKNYGLNGVGNFTVRIKINEQQLDDFLWTGSLTSLQQDSVLLAKMPLHKDSLYHISVEAVYLQDEVESNDTLSGEIFKESNSTSEEIEICEGDSVQIGEEIYYQAGVYRDTMTAFNGCDSIHITTLLVNDLPNVQISEFDPATICIDKSKIALPYATPVGGVYSGAGLSQGWFVPELAGAGSHVITYTYADSKGCQESDSAMIIVDLCTGLVKNSESTQLLVYPNPSAGAFTLTWQNDMSTDIHIGVFNETGQLVVEQRGVLESGVFKGDLSPLPKGIYWLKITGKEEVHVKRLIKN